MVEQKIAGSRIHHRRPLNTERVAEVDPADDIMIDAANDGWITHAAPGDGYCWVLGQVTVGFDIMPDTAFHLQVWYNVGAGNVVVFDNYVGAAAAAQGVNDNSMGIGQFHFPVGLKFPSNAQMRVTLFHGDDVPASSLNVISWVEMEL